MSNTTKYFEKFVGQRCRFIGTFDGHKRIRSNQYRVCFIFVHEASSGIQFRRHVNIMCNRGIYEHYFKGHLGQTFEFTAEVYRYTRNPHGKVYYRTHGIGLRDLKKIKHA